MVFRAILLATVVLTCNTISAISVNDRVRMVIKDKCNSLNTPKALNLLLVEPNTTLIKVVLLFCIEGIFREKNGGDWHESLGQMTANSLSELKKANSEWKDPKNEMFLLDIVTTVFKEHGQAIKESGAIVRILDRMMASENIAPADLIKLLTDCH